eukprot:scaffold9126_cov195-Cylindrotheca_fusiformis.AAC.1
MCRQECVAHRSPLWFQQGGVWSGFFYVGDEGLFCPLLFPTCLFSLLLSKTLSSGGVAGLDPVGQTSAVLGTQ